MSANPSGLEYGWTGEADPGITRWRLDRGRIDRERILRGWTRCELARHASVDPGTLSGLFRGKRRPTLGTVQAITRALGLSLADVIEFDDSRMAPGAEGRPRLRAL